MAPSVPRTRAVAALRMKQIALDNQSRTIRRLRAKLETERRESAATKEGLETKVSSLERDLQIQRCDNHSLRNTVTLCHNAIDRRISHLVEAKKEHRTNQANKQQARESHLECHHKLQACIQEAEDTIQEQHLIIEALVEEKSSLLQTIQGNRRSDSNNGGEGSSNSRGGLSREHLMAIATIVATTIQGLVNPNNNQAPPPTPPPRGTKYYYESFPKNKAPTFDGSHDSKLHSLG
ncbi:pleiotropic drug resistance protein 3-like [Dorcoceras hygrometricum]|uniref:Pleiotropic drug resistance protein 3-like n=1 Tax=Dorcoceras hygrometricum TaxID=472368 RepID=A0A2Z7APM2_9LAMI|nr:pleiotropic drug resistance protein 3-like [Dorcoceras hygrometricum]